MAKSELDPTLTRSQGACQVVVAYEDTSCRSGAMLICNRLVQEFWKDIEFKFSWWRFDYLRDAGLSAAAARAACKADLILVSAYSIGPFPSAFARWADCWAARRHPRDGALMGLFWTSNGQKDPASPKQFYLNQIANRAGLEFLPNFPNELPRVAFNAVEGGAALDHLFSDDYLLHHAPVPEGGINE